MQNEQMQESEMSAKKQWSKPELSVLDAAETSTAPTAVNVETTMSKPS